MQPLYTETEFKNAKSRDTLPLRCKHCNKTFHKSKRDIFSFINPEQRKYRSGDFCSLRCQGRYKYITRITLKCTQCKTPFNRIPSQIGKSKSGNNFCSRSCAGIYNSAHKKHGTRRSKLEIWLETQLPKLYPNLEFHFNRKDAIKSELDIFIPSLRLAFELNGIYHYEPIHGQNKLDKILSNDNRKMLACAERNIELCVIDNSSLTYFKEQRAMKFLKIIQNIINSKLSIME